MNTKELFRELFVLAVRLFALVLFYHGVRALTAPRLLPDGSLHPLSAEGLISAVIYFAAAFWLFKGPVIRWAYPKPATPESRADDISKASPQKAES
jgi:hypothetical protein